MVLIKTYYSLESSSLTHLLVGSGAIYLDGGINEADKFLAKYLNLSLNFEEFKSVWMDLPLHPLQVCLLVYYCLLIIDE